MQKPRVILLHGLARTALSMRSLSKALETEGFEPINLDYPSRKHTIEDLARQLVKTVRHEVPEEWPVHLVSHSLGGLVGRVLISLLPGQNWRNAVFLAPPHQGSMMARKMANHPVTRPFFRWYYGPAGRQVAQEMPELPLPSCPFGIIAGTKARSFFNPTSWLSRHLIDDKSDGTVVVQETFLENMGDFAEVYVDHTTIMNQPLIHRMVLHFLQHSAFPGEKPTTEPQENPTTDEYKTANMEEGYVIRPVFIKNENKSTY